MPQPTTLAEYYKSKNQSLPGWRDRAPIYEQAGLGSATSYEGSAEQNTALLNYFVAEDAKAAGGQTETPNQSTLPKPIVVGAMGEWVNPDNGVGYSGPQQDPSHISKSAYDASKADNNTAVATIGGGTGGVQTGGGQGDADAQAKQIAEQNRLQQEADAKAANDAANKIFESIGDTEPGDPDSRKSADILKQIEDMILGEDDDDEPVAPNLTELFNTTKAELGLDALETELAGIDSDIERLDAELLIETERQEGRLASRGTISAKERQLSKEAKFSKALLQIDRNAVARIASNKLSTLKMVMDLTQQDFANASSTYEKDYKKTLQLYSLFLGAETAEQNRVDRAKNDARANITLIHNALKAAGSTYASLTPDQQRKLTDLENQAGIPSGYSEAILYATASDDKIVAYKWSDDETQVSAIVQKPDGTISIITQPTGLPEVTDTGKGTEAEKLRDAKGGMFTQLDSVKGDDGFISPEDWKTAKAAWGKEGLGAEDFIEEFSQFINPDEPRGVNAYGEAEKNFLLYG